MARRSSSLRASFSSLPAALRGTLSLIIAVLLFVCIAPFMFSFGLITGIAYVLSFLFALWRGVLWRDPSAAIIIALAYAITAVAAHALLPAAYSGFLQQSFLNAALLLGVFVFIWWRVRHMKAGKRTVTS